MGPRRFKSVRDEPRIRTIESSWFERRGEEWVGVKLGAWKFRDRLFWTLCKVGEMLMGVASFTRMVSIPGEDRKYSVTVWVVVMVVGHSMLRSFSC